MVFDIFILPHKNPPLFINLRKTTFTIRFQSKFVHNNQMTLSSLNGYKKRHPALNFAKYSLHWFHNNEYSKNIW